MSSAVEDRRRRRRIELLRRMAARSGVELPGGTVTTATRQLGAAVLATIVVLGANAVMLGAWDVNRQASARHAAIPRPPAAPDVSPVVDTHVIDTHVIDTHVI